MNKWSKRVPRLRQQDLLFAVKAVADYLLDVVKGKQHLPYQPLATVFNLYVCHIENTDKKTDIWVGQLFFASRDEQAFTEIVDDVRNFLKTKGKLDEALITTGRDVTL